ncbi:MAG: ATP--guanido phosphotransferase, partial [Candidatus Omnitrophica bacterium]|nr:ATP--guanido phosphotransferase [Candidatus Omnitrophota bacterium]
MEKKIKFLPFEIIKKETEWIYSKFNEIVISSRVRLARNIKGYPFPYNMTYQESKKVEKFLINIFLKAPFNKIYIIDVSSLKNTQKKFLVERHLISKEFSENSISCKSIFIPEKKLTIMINEEDHLRIQSVYPGLNLKNCFKSVNEIDDLIEEKIEYAFLPNIGYLASCLTNTGTGLRASVLINIPGIKFFKKDKIIFNMIEKIGITIRGFYGEG